MTNEQQLANITEEQLDQIRQEFLKLKELNNLLVQEVNLKREEVALMLINNKQLTEKVNLLQEELYKYDVAGEDEANGS